MNNIVALSFEDKAAARAFEDKVMGMQEEGLLRVDDAVTVTVDDSGKPKLHQGFSVTRGAATVGGILGLVVGTLFVAPIAGAALGAAGGAALGKLSGDYGIDDEFIRETSATLAPGAVALFLLVGHADRERVAAELADTNATVITTTLDSDAEAALRAALSQD